MNEKNQTKRCTKCKLKISLEDFHRDSRRPDGHRCRCKKCLGWPTTSELKAKRERIPQSLIDGYKICNGCGQRLPLIDFYKDKYVKDGFTRSCKKCMGGSTNEEVKEHKERRLECLKTGIKKCNRCEQTKSITEFGFCKSSPDKLSWTCKECNRTSWKIKRNKYRERIRSYMRMRKFNPVYMKRKRKYEKTRRQIIKYKISNNISRSMRRSLSTIKEGRHWEELVGYTVNDLRTHLEKQFVNGMSWDNYGKWHIDHIRPMCSFNITDYKYEDFKKCWLLNNLQPLWESDNHIKGGNWNQLLPLRIASCPHAEPAARSASVLIASAKS